MVIAKQAQGLTVWLLLLWKVYFKIISGLTASFCQGLGLYTHLVTVLTIGHSLYGESPQLETKWPPIDPELGVEKEGGPPSFLFQVSSLLKAYEEK